MPKGIFLIFTMLTFSICYGQYHWREGKVVLKNGETLKGVIKMPMPTNKLVSLSSSKIHYKKGWKGKVKKFTEEQIDKVFYGINNSKTGYFEYIPIGKNKAELLRIIIVGKSKLYKKTVKTISYKSDGFIDPKTLSGGYLDKDVQFIDHYYIIRNGEANATYLTTKSLEEFKEAVIRYFADCKKIIKYLENDLYEEFDIKELVEDYNIFCE